MMIGIGLWSVSTFIHDGGMTLESCEILSALDPNVSVCLCPNTVCTHQQDNIA